MKNKKTIFVVVVLVVVVALVVVWAAQSDILQTGNQNPKVSELGFDNLDKNMPAGVDFALVYECDDFIIFCNSFGLWGYNLTDYSITFDVDLVKTFGEECMLQGSYDPYAVWVQGSADGKEVVISCADRNSSSDPETDRITYFIDIPTLTYQRGEYQPVKDVFQKESAVGYIIPGGTLGGSVYVQGDKEWSLFAEYENP